MSQESTFTWNIADNEARIIMTTNCNYKCIFCHSEGFDPYTQCKWKPEEDVVLKIIDDILKLGCTDITITGGEPLIYKDLITIIAEFIARKSSDTQITVVTNASLFTEEWLDQIVGFNNIRFNISLHTAEPEEYSRLTAQSSFSLEKIKNNLLMLKKIDIPFKLNCVSMRETMNKESIKNLVEFASEVGAKALKFIELLIMEQHESLFKSYIANTSIAKMLPDNFEFLKKTQRRDEYVSKKYKLTVELQKCRCRFGCKQCLEVNTTCLNAVGEFFPCFEYSSKSYSVLNADFQEVLQDGMKVIEKLADNFGDNSPSLIKDVKYIDRRRELNFIVDDRSGIEKFLKECSLIQKREYSDYYFSSPLDVEFQTVQMRVHHGDKENAKLIISTSQTEKVGEYTITTRIFQYKNKETMVEHPDFIINTMKRLGWHISHKIKTIEDEYDYNGIIFRLLLINQKVLLLNIFIDDIYNISKLIDKLGGLGLKNCITENIDTYYQKLIY
jgi:molybdenum cofactor biosynthesis enzyme MoaA